MESIPLSSIIIALFVKEGRPLRLVDIYRRVETRSVSKPTVYRRLQDLVSKGILSQTGEKYILVNSGDLVIRATDLSRLSELKPLLNEAEKGFRLTVYGTKDVCTNIDNKALASDFRKVVEKSLSSISQDLKGVLSNDSPSDDVLKKLIGIKLVFVASFDGTDFSTLTSRESDELTKKRKQALRIITQHDEVTIQELSKKLDLNSVQVRQVIDPILASGFATMGENGRIRLTMEMRS